MRGQRRESACAECVSLYEFVDGREQCDVVLTPAIGCRALRHSFDFFAFKTGCDAAVDVRCPFVPGAHVNRHSQDYELAVALFEVAASHRVVAEIPPGPEEFGMVGHETVHVQRPAVHVVEHVTE